MIPRTLFTPEHESFRDTVRRFIETEVTPHHADWEKAGQVPRSLWKKAGELGLLCVNAPEAYGGQGADFLYSAILIEEMARAGATGPAVDAGRCASPDEHVRNGGPARRHADPASALGISPRMRPGERLVWRTRRLPGVGSRTG